VEFHYEIPRPPTPTAIVQTSIDMEIDDSAENSIDSENSMKMQNITRREYPQPPPPYIFALKDIEKEVPNQPPDYYSFLKRHATSFDIN